MKWNLFITVEFFIAAVLSTASAEKILVFLPVAMKSHRNVFEPLIDALARRGHQLTVISPFEVKARANVTEIVPVTYSEIYDDLASPFDLRRQPTLSSMFSIIKVVLPASEKIIQVDKFNDALNEDYDLVLYNGFFNYYFECKLMQKGIPSITLTAMATPHFIATYTGNQLPTSFVPLPFLNLPDRMTFLQRFLNTILVYVIIMANEFTVVPKIRVFNEKYVGNDCPSEMAPYLKNTSMLFTNAFYPLTYPRPLLPDFVEVGGMHLRPPKTLPKDLDEWLNGAEHGFVYFSLGSVINTNTFPEEYRLKFLSVFSRLKQRVIWKWNSGHMENLPKNVRVSKWLPQQDILGHPNIRLFMTHGGLLSSQEAAYHGVPLLGIPFFADQDLNIRKAESSGYALTLEILDFTEETLENLLNDLLHDPKYKTRAKELSVIFHDQLQTPLERAVYWTEYVMRHRGAPHIRSVARNLNFFQYHSLDVIGFLLLVALTVLAAIVFSCRFCIRKVFTSNNLRVTTQRKKEQ